MDEVPDFEPCFSDDDPYIPPPSSMPAFEKRIRRRLRRLNDAKEAAAVKAAKKVAAGKGPRKDKEAAAQPKAKAKGKAKQAKVVVAGSQKLKKRSRKRKKSFIMRLKSECCGNG